MSRAPPPLLLALLLIAARAPACAGAEADSGEEDAELDDDSDSAPFMIVVEHLSSGGIERRCSGSLVSLRTGVTSAGCAAGAPRELWALAAAAAAGLAERQDGARRVSRIAVAGPPNQEEAHAGLVLDLAVLELERPFGSAARARPILMATAPQECSAGGGVCHVVRAVMRSGGRRARLRIVDATLAGDAPCARHVRHWASLRERSLCLSGPELCDTERGAGVVCGGKLCGVVSRSAGAGAGAAGGAADCGDTHAAQSVARWRRFLHCAHTLRACGRGACAELCSERQLLDETETELGGEQSGRPPAAPGDRARPQPAGLAQLASLQYASEDIGNLPLSTTHVPMISLAEAQKLGRVSAAPPGHKPGRTPGRQPARDELETLPPPSGGAPRLTPPLPLPPEPSPSRPTPVFEPNRPDFKAGEYGDNAAEYGAGEDGLLPTQPQSTPPPAPPAPSPRRPLPPDARPRPLSRTTALASKTNGSARVGPVSLARTEPDLDSAKQVSSTSVTVFMMLLFLLSNFV